MGQTEPDADAWVALAAMAADVTDPGHAASLAQLLDRQAEVADAFRATLESDPAAAIALAGSLSAFWQDSGRAAEGRRLTESALERIDTPVPAGAARAHVVASELAFRQGEDEPARRHAADAIRLGLEGGDARAVALAHVNLARVAFRAEDAAGIASEAELAVAAAPADLLARRGSIHMLAWSAHVAGDRGLARRRFEASIDLRRSMGDRIGVAVEEANLGDLAAEDGDLAEASRRLATALEVAVELRSRYLVLNLLPSIALVATGLGEGEDAARLLGAGDALSRATGLTPDPGGWQPAFDAVASGLGADHARLRAEGERLTEDEAVELALALLRRLGPAAAASPTDGREV